MADLIALTPFGDALPLDIGTCRLTAQSAPAITSVSIGKGQEKTVTAALKSNLGLTFPRPNRTSSNRGTRLIWTGAGQAMLLGAPLTRLKGATLTDQSDGWALMQLEGADSRAVLARLVPIDLRTAVFKTGHCAKTLLFHVPLTITRTGANAYDLMVFRSMAQTAVHDTKRAMASVAARLP